MTNRLTNILWDAWCLGSIVGIWPRYIEPRLLFTKKLDLPISGLPAALDGLKIVQFSDLHFHNGMVKSLLPKIRNTIAQFKPDIILFTGDFICRSNLDNPEELEDFLKSLSAPLGCYAILGNHDYDQFASVSRHGVYDVIEPDPRSPLIKGFSRLFKTLSPKGHFSKRIKTINYHNKLLELLNKTSFKVLNNETIQIPIHDSYLNICGLGDYICGQFNPNKAFQKYKEGYPGIILSHNPDATPYLMCYPGDIILSGHTHGGEINLPFLSKKFTLMEDPTRMRGLIREGTKWLYVNRGIGGDVTFRWFSPPEVLCLTVRKGAYE